ncbi:DUF456 domain-containing protein [Luteipulveratus sp. YIM 133132]|uniref:DUF456 domain-containing protein n=1 Tax=Luteipulveratus flavus TaxID=3031728 RepID=A0ABT6CBX9_9MICO|nr:MULTISPECIES: DUF456 domain-containing protein [unclassified Luteipulveratus]MDE9366779.1 DUF456 domain-containing protein [Luteipulveratus sp. YIM 133132]MDF8265812.1 DUF456 domain-containing protein [Luteipulveratus sp. YIM 133296]
MELVTVAAAVLVVGGILGLVIPVLPGLLLTIAGVLLWAGDRNDATGWTVFVVCLLIAAAGWTIQYLVPSRRMRAAGVPTTTLLFGAVCAVVGFFVIPVVGLFVGFVLGVYLAEQLRLRDASRAWTATKTALRGVLLSIGIELAAACLVACVWVAGLLITR